ncbi:hypothetical protein LG293_15855 (plasmid) [Citricoccus nitrophenolicus]
MTKNLDTAAAGNPHFQTAQQRIRTAQSRHDAVAVAGTAQGESTLALAFEQRTANLIATRDAMYQGLQPGQGLTEREQAQHDLLTEQINARLDLDTSQEPAAAPGATTASDPETIRDSFGRAYFYDVNDIEQAEDRWLRVGKDTLDGQHVVVLSTPRAPDVNVAQANAPVLAAAILLSVGLDPATTVLPTEVAQSV